MMKKYLIIIIISFLGLNACSHYTTNSIRFYNYTRESVRINVSARIKGQENFKNIGNFNPNGMKDGDPYSGSFINDFSKWDEFLIEYSNLERTEVYKKEIVSKRKLFGKWKGKIKYGKANWKAYVSEEDLEKYPEWKK